MFTFGDHLKTCQDQPIVYKISMMLHTEGHKVTIHKDTPTVGDVREIDRVFLCRIDVDSFFFP